MKHTRTANGLLTRQYRSVLRKCWLINVGLFALSATAVMEPTSARAEVATLSSTIDKISSGFAKSGIKINQVAATSVEYVTGAHNSYNLATSQGEHTNNVKIGGTTYYYTPVQGDTSIVDLAANAGAVLTSTGASADNYIFRVDNGDSNYTYYTYDTSALTTQTKINGTDKNYYAISHETPSDYTDGSSTRPTPQASNVRNYYTGYDNSEQPSTGNFQGGALTVVNDSVSDITADIYNNKNVAAEKSSGGIYHSGGKITNLTADFYQNTANYDGGALRNQGGDITNITGDFVGNKITGGDGGAVAVRGGTIGNISGNFIDNHADATNKNGGALHFRGGGNKTSISGNFTGNTANMYGGAINNGFWINDSGQVQRSPTGISSISGSFTDNTATNGSGGAISTSGKINSIDAVFVNNTAGASGGAIYNTGTFGNILSTTDTIRGTFKNNTAEEGGAIANTTGATFGNITGAVDSETDKTIAFAGNTAATVDGGAIYNKHGQVNLLADTSNIAFYHNTDSTGYNDIYNSAGSAHADEQHFV